MKIIFIFLLNLLLMATGKKITELDQAATLVAADIIVLEQSGNTVQAPLRSSTVADLDDFVNPCTLRCAQVTIVTASVLTLFATPILIVAAPGAGLAIEVVSASAELQFNATAYAANGVLTLLTLTANDQQIQWGTNFLFGTVSHIGKGIIQELAGIAQTSIIANQDLNVRVLNGNPTTGDSPIIVRVMYRLIAV